MGLFDYFTKEGKLKRHVRRMSNRDTPPEDREVSAAWLAEERSPKAIYGLITRFDMNVSNQMKDRAEKQYAFDLLVGIGQPVVEPLQTWLDSCRQYGWPLRLLETLAGEEAAIQAVYRLLEREAGKSSFNPEKKKELLVWFAERKHRDAIDAVQIFLKDFDEDVRYAAAEVMITQGDDVAREPLLSVLADPEEESNRLKHRLCDVFKSRGWSVEGAELEGRLPMGFGVRDGRIVAA